MYHEIRDDSTWYMTFVLQHEMHASYKLTCIKMHLFKLNCIIAKTLLLCAWGYNNYVSLCESDEDLYVLDIFYIMCWVWGVYFLFKLFDYLNYNRQSCYLDHYLFI